MECPGPRCTSLLLELLQAQKEILESVIASGSVSSTDSSTTNPRLSVDPSVSTARQGILFRAAPYQEDAPAIKTAAELAGAFEHLDYAIHRRYQNQLTRAERARMDNSIDNALFKIGRYLTRLEGPEKALDEARYDEAKEAVREGRERVEKMRSQARRAEQKLAQLANLTPETFEDFVGELFESLGYEVETVGGSGDEGVDLRVRRQGLLAIVQCKYHKSGVVGSPELQKFLGTIHHTKSHKGFFVTTKTFSLAAERFVANHPIELIDGPRLVELVKEALGPGAQREPEPAWF